MARNPITWRNVTANVGNPSSSLATAVSAFSNASRGGYDLVDSIREGEDRKIAANTNSALQGILADGKFTQDDYSQIQGNVDAGKLAGAINTGMTNEQNRALDSELLTQRQRENSPEYLAQQEAEAKRKADLEAQNLQLRNQEIELRRQGAQVQADEIARQREMREQSESISTGFNEVLGARFGEVDADIDSQLAELSKNGPVPPEKVNELEALRIQQKEDIRNRETPGYLQRVLAENPNISPQALQASAPGQSWAVTQEQEAARALERQKLELAREKERQKIAGKGATGPLTNVIFEGGQPRVGSPEEIRQNKISANDAIKEIEARINEDVNDSERQQIQSLISEIGGNKSLFLELLREDGVIDLRFDNEFRRPDGSRLSDMLSQARAKFEEEALPRQ